MGCGMAFSSFLCTVGTGTIAKQGIARKGILLDRAARRGIAVPASMVLLDDAWRYARSHDLLAGRVDALTPRDANDYDAASPVIASLIDGGSRFVAVAGLKLLAPGDTGQLNDPGPRAARTAVAYTRDKDEMYLFQGGSYTPDQVDRKSVV